MDKNDKKEEDEENDSENLRELILQQLANLEQSDVSDDDSYKVRLSCILEDDESESSGAAQKECVREVEKRIKANKESEKGPPDDVRLSGGSACESELSDDFACDSVQITDLDLVAIETPSQEKVEELDTTEKTDETLSEENYDDLKKKNGFAIKKLKSSDNVHSRPFIIRRRELSSDSSDLDTSLTNSGEGPSKDFKIEEICENTLISAPEIVNVESETSADEDVDQTLRESMDIEVVDNETLSSIFAKVSKTYLEKTKANVKWEETEKVDERLFVEATQERARSRERDISGEHMSLQDAHIRGTSPKEYNPPVPPETYLWEELKRLRERGGYPWTYLDKPPFDEATWKKYMEHVYEPINPPPLTMERKPELPQEISIQSSSPQSSSIPETDKHNVSVQSKRERFKKSKESIDDSKTPEDLEVEQISSGYELHKEVEKNFTDSSLGPSGATSPTTPSVSKTDVTTSVLDSSGFEDLSVKQSTLVKRKKEQMRAQAHDLQEKLKTQAGKIKNKISSIQKPALRRSKNGTSAEKQKFRFPEMHPPKINFPDPSKFKLPEKAKFHMPESAKLQFPNRPKFHLPERPKFNVKERAKIRLPEKAKFHLPDKSKFHLPDKSKFHLPKTKFHLPDRAKLERLKPEIPKFSRSQEDRTSDSTRGKFDFISYPKLFSKHSKDYVTSSPKPKRVLTSSLKTKKELGQSSNSEKLNDLQYMDDDLDEDIKETDSHRSESVLDYREKDLEYTKDFGKAPHEVRTISTKSSTSQMSDLEFENWEKNGRKKGVLEEINADEYFLRQKGISQDDIDMGKYLSHEIREAFRSPEMNALAKMDYLGDENVEPVHHYYPERPTRATALKKKSILKKTSERDQFIPDDGYKTYPPRRPARKSRSQSKSLVNEEAVIAESTTQYEDSEVNRSVYDDDDDEINLSRYDNIPYNDDNFTEYYKHPGPPKEYEHYKVPRSLSPNSSLKRKASLENDYFSKSIQENWDETEIIAGPPKPLERKKSKKKKKQMEESTSEGLIFQEFPQKFGDSVPQPQTFDSPIPPKRTRSRSSGFRSLRSLQMDDDLSRSFESEPSKQKLMDEIAIKERKLIEETNFATSSTEVEAFKSHEYEVTDLDDVGFGYATVGKTSVSKSENKKKKPERPPPPKRKKGTLTYNTYPRKTPVRPLRNYSTLGPTRPPRKKKMSPIERSLAERQLKAYSEIKLKTSEEPLESIKLSGNIKDLQTEQIIEKMKGRPLPPPPRPPRQKDKGPEDHEITNETDSLSVLKDAECFVERRIVSSTQEPPSENKIVDEVNTSTQTDLWEGEDDSEIMQEFSHEQLRIQQAFLNEMKREEEELRERGKTNESDMISAELKCEVIKQIQDFIEEEENALREQQEKSAKIKQQSHGFEDSPQASAKAYLDVSDADMGYASLDRKGHKQEVQKQDIQSQIPSKMEKLQLKELEVETISVHEIQAEQIFVKELQSNRIASEDIDNTGGSIAFGNTDLPPSLIDQIVAKIPWDSLRQSQEQNKSQEEQKTFSPTRPQRKHRVIQQFDDSDDESQYQPKKSHRRHHRPQHSSEEEESRRERRQVLKVGDSTKSIPELSLQLARACTFAGAEALRSFVRINSDFARTFDRELCVQAVLCIAVALIAGYFLFGFDAKIVHLHRWDFTFPPQEPPETGA